MSRRVRWIAIVLTYAVVAANACSEGITAPSHAAPQPAIVGATLTIRVLARTTELPIEGALVHHGRDSWVTGASGQLAITVPLGKEIAIDVAAPGYEPMGASAVLASDERWTFYLAASSS